ncbi:hypothetical protein [Aurantibacillus circumpalustris]|uniref:hypothetical protein n=1 Tax=Aurantibacillus circumpalustris TaxID=3036359 RepID=UPI00295B0624|nr:hypothetical protein [Aurantibacillus circumpalustris]
MNKLRNTPKAESNSPKKSISNFGRKAAKLDTSKKTKIFEGTLDKTSVWLKRENESWDY